MTITAFTLDDLKKALFSAAGADEGIDMAGDILDRSFTELGYDSLALLETAAFISREHGIALEDDAVTAVTTPRELIALITSA
ncbi:acyl carrier protein [Streptomyces sp. 35M1]|uniref:phosphopantetheine-binding protein n=1 Tax=Streptomyces sp. 35M1 TaxID=3142978 RepID=UPI0039905160